LNEEKNISNDLLKGILLLLIGALMLGSSGIFVKISESSPSVIAFYRSLLALPFLYFWMKYE
jgi:drug/metabolite transporter (DMT)-like permease